MRLLCVLGAHCEFVKFPIYVSFEYTALYYKEYSMYSVLLGIELAVVV